MLKNGITIFLIAVVTFGLFYPTYQHLKTLEDKNAEYAGKIQELERKNTMLAEERRRLLEDPVYLEKVAREKMGIARDGEIVVKVEKLKTE